MSAKMIKISYGTNKSGLMIAINFNTEGWQRGRWRQSWNALEIKRSKRATCFYNGNGTSADLPRKRLILPCILW